MWNKSKNKHQIKLSALVGLGFPTIDSNICVAQITGFPATLHFEIIIFYAKNTFSVGISIPRSPLATIMPSASAMIASILNYNRRIYLCPIFNVL